VVFVGSIGRWLLQDTQKEIADVLGINMCSLRCCLVMISNVVVTPGDKLMDLLSWSAHELFDLDMAD